jgi:hypothetical protein
MNVNFWLRTVILDEKETKQIFKMPFPHKLFEMKLFSFCYYCKCEKFYHFYVSFWGVTSSLFLHVLF